MSERTGLRGLAKKRLCVVTMVGNIDLIGELDIASGAADSARLERPCVMSLREGPGNMHLFDMLRGGVLSGEFIELNMLAVLWVAEPSPAIAKAYRTLRSGLVVDAPGYPGGSGMNQ